MSRDLRATVLTGCLAAALALGVTPPTAAGIAEPVSIRAGVTGSGVLARASHALGGDHTTSTDATLALRDLVLALPRLSAAERRQARLLLARPTDGPDDPANDGYRAKSRRDCDRHICVHWVRRTRDAPPDRTWVTTTQRVLRKTWRAEIGRLGYREPLPDRGRGGNDKLDVYLKDVGSEGLYGYCVPERARTGDRWSKPGYCVLDDDFARRQFGARPKHSLRVTAAHEFFHAVQFAYDYAEDKWLMEASATWMEERVTDRIDDNRQYLRYGQVRRPASPVDTFDPQGFQQYGNWAFLEHLSERFGVGVVRRTWRLATGPDDHYSTWAVARALPRRTNFFRVFRRYAAANVDPARSYREGEAWPTPTVAEDVRLSEAAPLTSSEVRIDHLAARHLVVRPGRSLTGGDWRVRVTVDGPAAATDPGAVLTVRPRRGEPVVRPIRLDAGGQGRLTVDFGHRRVRRATLTLVNASTRFSCWEGTLTWSCQGSSRDDDRAFGYRIRAFRT